MLFEGRFRRSEKYLDSLNRFDRRIVSRRPSELGFTRRTPLLGLPISERNKQCDGQSSVGSKIARQQRSPPIRSYEQPTEWVQRRGTSAEDKAHSKRQFSKNEITERPQLADGCHILLRNDQKGWDRGDYGQVPGVLHHASSSRDAHHKRPKHYTISCSHLSSSVDEEGAHLRVDPGGELVPAYQDRSLIHRRSSTQSTDDFSDEGRRLHYLAFRNANPLQKFIEGETPPTYHDIVLQNLHHSAKPMTLDQS